MCILVTVCPGNNYLSQMINPNLTKSLDLLTGKDAILPLTFKDLILYSISTSPSVLSGFCFSQLAFIISPNCDLIWWNQLFRLNTSRVVWAITMNYEQWQWAEPVKTVQENILRLSTLLILPLLHFDQREDFWDSGSKVKLFIQSRNITIFIII